MAERNAEKPKRSLAAKSSSRATGGGLAADNAALKAELEQARARIAELERRQAEILNRIDWAIDSLHNLRE
jgi:hypothetical protein